jgi:hypothetical protein
MAYSDFSLPDIEQRLGCTLREHPDLFASVADVAPSELLRTLLALYLPLALAINTEKGRSELLIAPILVEVRERSDHHVSLFSGTELSADPERGLNGYCDFILTRSEQQQFIRAPIVTVVEAKNDNPKGGIGQCLASMIGAQVFNERRGEPVGRLYGAVTTGTLWRFLALEGNEATIDAREYYIDRVGRILGVLLTMVGATPSRAT